VPESSSDGTRPFAHRFTTDVQGGIPGLPHCAMGNYRLTTR
jgi:hypothetical protein